MVQSEFAPIQAFRIAVNLVGVELHPEIDLRTVRHLNQIGVTGSMISGPSRRGIKLRLIVDMRSRTRPG
jgi:GMP synthase-like glutamine amidotransferase